MAHLRVGLGTDGRITVTCHDVTLHGSQRTWANLQVDVRVRISTCKCPAPLFMQASFAKFARSESKHVVIEEGNIVPRLREPLESFPEEDRARIEMELRLASIHIL